MTPVKRKAFSLMICVALAALALSWLPGSPVRAVETAPGAPAGSFVVGTYSSSPGAAIPDATGACNTASGFAVIDTIVVPDGGTINDVNLDLNIPHTWIGDLTVVVISPSGTGVAVIENIGNAAPPGGGGCGCSADNVVTTLDDASANGPIETACPPTLADYIPLNPLAAFNGESLAGTWTIEVRDWSAADTGTLVSWGLVIDYTPPPASTLVATGACSGDNLAVSITGGDGPFNITGTGPGLPVAGAGLGTTTLTGPGDWTGVTVSETTGDLEAAVLGAFSCPAAAAAVPGIPVPHFGLVLIGYSQLQAGYDAPGGNPVVLLPKDADGNGFDTYVVTSIAYVGGQYWVGLWVGSANWVWVPLDKVTRISDLPLPEAVEGAETK